MNNAATIHSPTIGTPFSVPHLPVEHPVINRHADTEVEISYFVQNLRYTQGALRVAIEMPTWRVQVR